MLVLYYCDFFFFLFCPLCAGWWFINQWRIMWFVLFFIYISIPIIYIYIYNIKIIYLLFFIIKKKSSKNLRPTPWGLRLAPWEEKRTASHPHLLKHCFKPFWTIKRQSSTFYGMPALISTHVNCQEDCRSLWVKHLFWWSLNSSYKTHPLAFSCSTVKFQFTSIDPCHDWQRLW